MAPNEDLNQEEKIRTLIRIYFIEMFQKQNEIKT